MHIVSNPSNIYAWDVKKIKHATWHADKTLIVVVISLIEKICTAYVISAVLEYFFFLRDEIYVV